MIKEFKRTLLSSALGILLFWGIMSYLNREKIEFDTYYSVTYLDVSGAERTQVFVLPDGIYGLDVVGEDGVYNLYVRHEGGRTYLKSAVIEVMAFKRVKPYDSLEFDESLEHGSK